MKNFQAFITILITITLLSCQKKEARTIDQNELKININRPAEAQIFKSGDTVFIKASASYNTQLHGYSLNITNKNTQEVYFDVDEHLHDAQFDIDTFWVDNLNQNADLLLRLTVEVDHNGNEDAKEVSFKVVH